MDQVSGGNPETTLASSLVPPEPRAIITYDHSAADWGVAKLRKTDRAEATLESAGAQRRPTAEGRLT